MFPIMKKLINVLICHVMYHVHYEKIEKLNQYDRCIICPSHSNIFDPFFLFPKTNQLYIMAKSEIFRNKLISKIFTHYHVFPIKREKQDVKGVRKAIELFEKNKEIKLLMFPEGGILKDNEIIRKVKNGAVFIAATVEVPIIPVFITREPKLFGKVNIKIGEAICVDKEVLEDKEKLKSESKKLIDAIYDK